MNSCEEDMSETDVKSTALLSLLEVTVAKGHLSMPVFAKLAFSETRWHFAADPCELSGVRI